MKNLSIIVITIVLLATSNSCSEDFLTKEPLGTTSENVFYNTKGIDAATKTKIKNFFFVLFSEWL